MARRLTENEREIFHKLTNVPVTVLELTDNYQKEEASRIRPILNRLHSEGLADKFYDSSLGGWRWRRA